MKSEGNEATIERYSGYAQECIDQFGYVVMVWVPGPKDPPIPPSVLPENSVAFSRDSSAMVPVKILVIGESSESEFDRQAKMFGFPARSCPAGSKFFKVIAE